MKLFFSIDDDISLLPFFLEHYKKIGVTEFHCLRPYCSIASSLLFSKEIKLHYFDPNDGDSFFQSLFINFQKIIDSQINNQEWYLISDLDEFHEFGFIELNNIGTAFNCVMGKWVDRVAADGKIPELRYDIPLNEQFPLISHITAKVLNGGAFKVMALRGHHQLQGGNHHVVSDHMQYPKYGYVYHYKWHQGIFDRINRRMKNKHYYLRESEDFLKYWEKHSTVLVGG